MGRKKKEEQPTIYISNNDKFEPKKRGRKPKQLENTDNKTKDNIDVVNIDESDIFTVKTAKTVKHEPITVERNEIPVESVKITGHTVPWLVKYKPKHVNDMQLPDDIKNKINSIANSDITMNIILEGPTGTGKTTILECLAEIIKKEKGDIYISDAAEDRGLEAMKNTVTPFVKCLSQGKKILIFDDYDHNTTAKSQNELANIMKEYNDNVSYCFTCNDTKGIIDKIQNKCIILKTKYTNEKEFYDYIKKIASAEHIRWTAKGLQALYMTTRGDLRSAINNMEIIVNCFGEISAKNVHSVCYQPHPDNIIQLLQFCVNNDLHNAINSYMMLKKRGYCNSDILQTIMRIIKIIGIDENIRMKFMIELAHTHTIIFGGLDYDSQIKACISRMCMVTFSEGDI